MTDNDTLAALAQAAQAAQERATGNLIHAADYPTISRFQRATSPAAILALLSRLRAAEARAERLAEAGRTLVEAWEDGAFMSDRTMRPHIRRLRDALAEARDV
jgi:DNA-binding response OmpR family regulator